MVSLISGHTRIPESHHTFSVLNYPLIPSRIFIHNSKRRLRIYKKAAICVRDFGFLEVKRERKFEGEFNDSWCCLCNQGEGDVELEAEIIGFMDKSEKPNMFPTREELIKAGRMDLVEAIKKRGGWYSLGWDEENVGDNAEGEMDFEIEEFQRRVESCKESVSLGEHSGNSSSEGEKEDGLFSGLESNSDNLNSLQLPSSLSSGRSLEISAAEDTGIEGILNRLEKRRNSDFGIDSGKYGYEIHATSKDEGDDSHFKTSLDVARVDYGENDGLTPGLHHKSMMNNPVGKISPKFEPETWRTWSNQRAGIQYSEFEAAEISFSKKYVEHNEETRHDGMTAITGEYAEEINHSWIRTHLQHLESELSVALHSLRSEREGEESIPEDTGSLDPVVGSSLSDLQKLSDDQEFQENELMSAQERLRSLRAKLVVLEGRMSMAIADSQKIVERKQEQIDGARKALQLLQTTCIVWHNSASEVFLAGSFDGWTTQRKMEKSKAGIFSVCLMLYPGRYEIKFIVDGEWKIDPLRPVINNGGFENNILIVT